MPDYKMTLRDLESQGGIHRLDRNGLNLEKVMKRMYKLTDGATTEERTKIVENLYDRRELC